MTQGIPSGLPQYIQQTIAQASGQLQQQFNQFAGAMRNEHAKKSSQLDQRLHDMATIANSLRQQREGNGPGIIRVEDLPGRRVPFEYLVDILIANNDTTQQQGSITISQEGPFVATKRYAVFQSLLQYQISLGASVAPAKYPGRSYGRWRPISSAHDINDSINNNGVMTLNPFSNGAYIGIPELTSSQSSFRTMEFDGRIMVVNAGSSFPRMNIPEPSDLWDSSQRQPTDLGCLDFFERGEVITFYIQPTHVNNPPAGNADGSNIFGVAGWPFLAGQYDRHEGIITPSAFSVAGSPSALTRLATESITRLPDGVLTIGFIGYRIQQPPGI